jgi:hypothetical protein
MEENNICIDLIKRWKELKGKLPTAQDVVPGKPIQPSYISTEELIELESVERRLGENCWSKLSPEERFEIDKERFLKNPL